MKFTRTLIAALALAGPSAAALAQKVAPGLWEMQMSMKSAGGEMEAQMAQMREQMAKLPPEQRKMAEEMMARQGVGLGAPGGGIRFCISKEQADRGDVPQDAKGNCKRESLDRSGSTMKFKFSCTEPPSSGTGEVVFSGDKAYAMKMVVDTQAQGRPQRTEMQQNAKWLSADCGSLQPAGRRP